MPYSSFTGEMRGEEKPYEMPVAENDQQPEIPSAGPVTLAPSSSSSSSAATNVSGDTKQKMSRQFSNNLAIQQHLKHLSPVHPKALSVDTSTGIGGRPAPSCVPPASVTSVTSVNLQTSPSPLRSSTSSREGVK